MRALRVALPPKSVLTFQLAMSHDLRARFDAGSLDAIVVRRETGGTDGEILGHDPLGWRAAGGFTLPPGQPVPLASLGPACGVRAAAIRQLDRASRPWRDVFMGGSCAALLAAVNAGLGVAPMGAIASGRMPDRGAAMGLPDLPASEIVMFARASSHISGAAIRALDGAIRAVLG